MVSKVENLISETGNWLNMDVRQDNGKRPALYKFILDNIKDGISIADIEGNILYANNACAQILGCSLEEISGRNIRKVYSGNGKPIFDLIDLSKSQPGVTFIKDLNFNSFSGQVKVITGIPEEGVSPFISIVMTDVSEIENNRKKIEQAAGEWRATVDAIPDWISIHDNENKIARSNKAFASVFNMTPKEILGRTPRELVPETDDSWSEFPFIETTSDMESRNKEVFNNKLGIALEVVRTPMFGSEGQVTGYVHVMRDITKRKQAEEILRKSYDKMEVQVEERTKQLKEVNKELEAFVYSVSHDLRAPLRSIDGFTQIIMEDYSSDIRQEAMDHFQRVRNAVHRMENIIEGLLGLSRISRYQITCEEIDLSNLARQIENELRIVDPERNVRFLVQDNVTAYGDAHLLRVVLDNLINNAWKYTMKKSSATIRFGMSLCNGEPVYSVQDDGAGFDMLYSSKLFGPFERLHSSDEFQGTGIGLATVKRIISNHGGKVWAEGAVGKGATFYFTLKGVDKEVTV